LSLASPSVGDASAENANVAICVLILAQLAASPSEGNYVKLSLIMWAKGKDREALSVLEEAIKADPRYTSAQELLNSFE